MTGWSEAALSNRVATSYMWHLRSKENNEKSMSSVAPTTFQLVEQQRRRSYLSLRSKVLVPVDSHVQVHLTSFLQVASEGILAG